MTFKDMKLKYDKFGAYNDFVTIAHAKQIRLYPESYDNIFPEKCSWGSEMIINMATTKLTCCDPKCHIKQALALSELFSRFGFKGVSDATCSNIYETLLHYDTQKKNNGEKGLFSYNSYLEVLLLDNSDIPPSIMTTSAGIEFVRGLNFMKEQILTFPEMIANLGLPEFDTTAYKLFNEFSSAEELINTIKSAGGVAPFCEQRGVYALQKKFWLQVSLTDICIAGFVFQNNIRMTGLQQLNICITGSLRYKGSRITKNDFVDFSNAESFTRDIGSILIEALSSYEIVTAQALKDMSNLIKCNLLPETESTAFPIEQIKDYIESLQLPPVQLFEVRMTTAMKSVAYIVADVASGSAKYLEGLRRGEITDSDGEVHKVLITSDEFIETIHRKVRKYEKELIKQCQKFLQGSSMQEMTTF